MTRYRREGSTLWRIASGHLLLRGRTGGVVDVSGAAGVVWMLLEDPVGAAELIDEVVEVYGAPHDVVGPAVTTLLSELADLGFVEAVA